MAQQPSTSSDDGRHAADAAHAQAQPVVQVQSLRKVLGGKAVLHDVSFQVRPGETLVIMGGSGCGKTTAMRCMIGYYKPDGGVVKMFGQDLADVTETQMDSLRRRFGILFQSGALFNSMNVGDNVSLPMREHTELDENIIQIMVKLKLGQVGLRSLDDLMTKMPSEISGGMKKRVGLARAIALDPDLLFCDEPSSGLDPIMTAVIDQLILGLTRKLGVTSVVVTHDMTSAFRVADYMVMLHQGTVQIQGTPEEVQASDDPVVQQFIKGSPDGPLSRAEEEAAFIKSLIGE